MIWDYVLSNGSPAGQVMAENIAMMDELRRIHGLELGTPLVVGAVSRIAGLAAQSVSEVGGDVTVTRLL